MKGKNKIEYWANNSKIINKIKKSLLEKGLEVDHIITASTIPVLKFGEYYLVGVGNIIANYSLDSSKIF